MKELSDMPSYAKEDTKAHYSQIVARFQEADYADLQNLVYLIDTIDQMSPEIYEHYRSLQDLFREKIRSFLKSIHQADESYLVKTDQERQLLTYCLQKACANHTLLREKYQDLTIRCC